MVRRPRLPLLLTITAALALVCAFPALSAELIRKITSVEGITEYKLSNGLQVLLYPDPTRAKVTVNLTVFVGSRHEGYGETGMAHLLEHMLFKPTAKHPNIPAAMKERGADFNGSTWLDRTNYYETLPSTGDNLEFAIALEADRLINCPIRPEDLATEFSVVRNEFERGENYPAAILSQRMIAAAYEWHNYGKSTIGNKTDIERVPVDNLREFYKKFYQPDNAMLVIAGKFDERQALDLVEKHFGSIPAPSRKLPQTYTEEPPQDGERTVTLRRVGDSALLGVVYHVPSGTHEQFAAVELLGHILDNPPSGRLYKALVETKIAAGVSVSAEACHDPGILEISVDFDTKDRARLDTARDALFAAIAELQKNGATQQEVDRARASYLKNRELAAADPNRIAIQLSEWAAQGDWRLYFLFRDRIEKVTPAEITAVARAYLTPSNRTIGYFIPTSAPERTPVPPAPDVAAMLKDYKGRPVSARPTETFDPSPLAIESKIQRPPAIQGVKVALLPKRTFGESVTLRLSLHYGNANNLKGMTEAANILPRLMMRGTRHMNHQQIQDALDRSLARIAASGGGRGMTRGGGGPGTLTMTLQTKRHKLIEALDILRQILREPTLPDHKFELMKKQEVARLEQSRSEPTRIGFVQIQRMMVDYPPDDVRYVPTIDEEIERVRKVSVDQVRSLYHDYLGAEHGELVILGDFEPTQVLPVLNQMLEGWKASKPYARVEMPYQTTIKPHRERIETPDKANAIYVAGMIMPLRDDNPDYPALLIGNFVLGGGAISSRIADRLRQKGGLSYSAMSAFAASSLDQRASLLAMAIYNPLNVDKVTTGVDEEIARLLKDGISESELASAKVGFISERRNEHTNDQALASLLSENLFLDRTLAHEAELETKINNLTVDKVNTALRKHLDPSRLAIVTAGDFAKKQGSAKGEKP